jgi:ketosteroid isomerase-like protein
VGHEAIQKAVFESALAEHWTELRINPVRVVAAGTTVLAEGRYVGTTKAGEKLDAIFAHVWDFDGDLIVRVQQYSDTWQFHHVLGLDA